MAERPEDLNLPNAVIARIIKDALPEGVSVAKDARLAISKAASVFVLYATSCANNFAMKGKRKTISAQDVLLSMNDMEFDRFVEPLKECIEELYSKSSVLGPRPTIPPVLRKLRIRTLAAYKTAQKGKKEAATKRKSKETSSEEPILIDEENSENTNENSETTGDCEIVDDS